MDYESFREQLEEDLKQGLKEQGFGDITTGFEQITKANVTYEALVIRGENENIGLNFSLEKAYEVLKRDGNYDEVLRNTLEVVKNGMDHIPTVDIQELSNYESMKDKLSIEVIATEPNKEFLQNIPHETMEDISVIYRLVLEQDEESRKSVVVNNHMLKNFGISEEQLKADALENAPQIRPAVIKGMSEMIMEIMEAEMMPFPLPEEEKMYVATVPDRTGGAGVLAYEQFMEQAAERLGGDFFILPSSLHELILVPDDGTIDQAELKAMVENVNSTTVDPEEKLTDSVYHYDSKDHIFELAEKFSERKQEREEQKEEGQERSSVVKELKEKQREIKERSPKSTSERKTEKTKQANER